MTRNIFLSKQVLICLLFLFIHSQCKSSTPITDEMIERAGNEDDIFDWEFLAKKLQDLKNGIQGIDINEKNNKNDDFSALHYAIHLGDLDTAKALLDIGAKVDVQDDYGWTPLYWAIVNAKEELVKLLINHGANVNTKDAENRTPLYIAALDSTTGIAKLLMNHGANLEPQD